jgi:hypothetical protein
LLTARHHQRWVRPPAELSPWSVWRGWSAWSEEEEQGEW